jgi:hypothetical protein
MSFKEYTYNNLPDHIRELFDMHMELVCMACRLEEILEEQGWTEEDCCQEGCERCEGENFIYRYQTPAEG